MYNNNGFSLIELVIVIMCLGVLSIWLMPKAVDIYDSSRISATEAEMRDLMRAIVGNESTGEKCYFQDVGALPAVLGNLTTDPGTGFNPVTGSGWNGPYINAADDKDNSSVADILEDAWGNPYRYTPATVVTTPTVNGIQYRLTRRTVTITSDGPNETAADADDIQQMHTIETRTPTGTH